MRENHMSNPCGHARGTLAIKQNMAYMKEAITRALHVTVKEMGYSEMRSKQEVVEH